MVRASSPSALSKPKQPVNLNSLFEGIKFLKAVSKQYGFHWVDFNILGMLEHGALTKPEFCRKTGLPLPLAFVMFERLEAAGLIIVQVLGSSNRIANIYAMTEAGRNVVKLYYEFCENEHIKQRKKALQK